MKIRDGLCGSTSMPYVVVTSSPRVVHCFGPTALECTWAHLPPPSSVRYVRNRSVTYATSGFRGLAPRSYGASNQMSGPGITARSSSHDPAIVGDGLLLSRWTMRQVRPPSLVRATPLYKPAEPAPSRRPSKPTYAFAL